MLDLYSKLLYIDYILSLYFVYLNSTHIFICDSRFKWFQPFSSHQYSRPKKNAEARWLFVAPATLLTQVGPKRAQVWCTKVIFANWNVSTPKAPKSKSWMTPSDFTRLLRSESWTLEILFTRTKYLGENVNFKSQVGKFCFGFDVTWAERTPKHTHHISSCRVLPRNLYEGTSRHAGIAWERSGQNVLIDSVHHPKTKETIQRSTGIYRIVPKCTGQNGESPLALSPTSRLNRTMKNYK